MDIEFRLEEIVNGYIVTRKSSINLVTTYDKTFYERIEDLPEVFQEAILEFQQMSKGDS